MWKYIGAANGHCIISNKETGETQTFMDYEDAMYALSQMNGTTFPPETSTPPNDWRMPYARDFGEPLFPTLFGGGGRLKDAWPEESYEQK